MNILSLFDGMSCGQIALERAGIKVDNYYASEIKPHAIQLTQHHYPKTIQLGNVTQVKGINLPKINLLIGGSPCQDFSRLKVGDNNTGYNGEKSKLFFEYVRIKKETNPDFFLLENVFMKKEFQDKISQILGVKPIRINSNLVSYQNRDRLYWTNIPGVSIPFDRGITFQAYKESGNLDQYAVNKTPSRIKMWEYQCKNVTYATKICCLTCKQDRRHNAGLVEYKDFCRYLTRKECEIAQTVPVGYTDPVSINKAYDLLGDGWTIDVIAHIFSFLPSEYKVDNSLHIV